MEAWRRQGQRQTNSDRRRLGERDLAERARDSESDIGRQAGRHRQRDRETETREPSTTLLLSRVSNTVTIRVRGDVRRRRRLISSNRNDIKFFQLQ